jgi:hypothetical protein
MWSIAIEQSEDRVHYQPSSHQARAMWTDFLVVALPRAALGWDGGGQVSFFVKLIEGGLLKERYPERGVLEFPVPEEDFERSQWFV